MGLHRFRPRPSGRMGILSTVATIKEAVLIEFGSMGHMLYGESVLRRIGAIDTCKLYSTHIDETDISLGGANRLTQAIEEAIQNEDPKAVFVLPSAIPEMIGTDLPAICEEVEAKYPEIPIIPFGYGGFNIDQYKGVEEALLLLTKRLVKDVALSEHPTYNIIGSCSDMFRFQSDVAELVRMLSGAFAIEPNCIMTSQTSVTDIMKLPRGHVNLVIRQEGIKTAKFLQKKFGTPYIVARPYGIEKSKAWLHEIKEILGISYNESFMAQEESVMMGVYQMVCRNVPYYRQVNKERANFSIGGHVDVASGIFHFACEEIGLIRGVCFSDSKELETDSIPYYNEDQWTSLLDQEQKGIIMASGEILKYGNRHHEMQIANPDLMFRLNPYEPPFVGFRGALHLMSLWTNSIMQG